jgi:integrase
MLPKSPDTLPAGASQVPYGMPEIRTTIVRENVLNYQRLRRIFGRTVEYAQYPAARSVMRCLKPTGPYRPEMLSIRRKHIDIPRRTISIPRAKAGAREQPITAHLAGFLQGYLDALPAGSPWLFPSLGSKIT